ncbi:MAG: nitroreductase family protein [Desulfurellaceae bacterium]|nr:nitroreductase family protein [Desulfurellaceae bacterium]
MEFKEVIGRRRSIRYFLPYRPVEREKIQTIMEATRLSSCAVNASFLRAIVVERDKIAPEDLEALKVPTTTLQLDMAPVHIYFYGNLNAIQESHGQTLKELFDVGALNPTHGWSHKFIEETVWAQILDPISKDPNINPIAVSMDSGVAMNQALLTAFDEGLGALLTAFNAEKAKAIFKVPDHFMPLYAMLIGYPAESWEAGGQRPRPALESLYFEGEYGVPMQRDPAVVEQLKQDKMIQEPAPLPWRKDEVRALSRMFGLPE